MGGRFVSIKQSIKTSGALHVHHRRERLGERYTLISCFLFELCRGMAFGLNFTGGRVSEINTFYPECYWPAAGLDMNNNDDYAQESRGK